MAGTATKGFTGKGATFSIGTTPSPASTFTVIAQLKTLAFSGQKWSFDDITCLSSPVVGAGVLEESLPTKVSPGELAIAGVFLPSDAGQPLLLAAFNSGGLNDFKVQLPVGPGQTTTGNLYTFSGYVQDMPTPDIQVDKAINFKATIKLNTLLTLTPGTLVAGTAAQAAPAQAA